MDARIHPKLPSASSRNPQRVAIATPPVTFAEALRVWVTVALLSFGGPAGQIATMHRILVEEKRWISESRFLHALGVHLLILDFRTANYASITIAAGAFLALFRLRWPMIRTLAVCTAAGCAWGLLAQ